MQPKHGFLDDRLYCAHCPLVPNGVAGSRTVTTYGIVNHLKTEHDLVEGAVQEGVDYYKGWQARQVFHRRQVESEKAAQLIHFAFEQPDYNVDDFLVDCGDAA